MATADQVDANERGTALGIPGIPNGDPMPWRVLPARHSRNIGDYVNNPSTQEWNSTHNGKSFPGTSDGWEQVKTIGEQISWKHTFTNGKTYDVGDILIGLGELLVKQGIL